MGDLRLERGERGRNRGRTACPTGAGTLPFSRCVPATPTHPPRSRSIASLHETVVGALADRYRIERELGRGGMGSVFLAEDLKHRRKVAVKLMNPEISAAIGSDRFLREIEAAASLSHPHILPLHDSGAANGMLFYVTPFIEGGTLRQRLEKERQLPAEDALRLARQIASALAHAHTHGLVHRDIKPENVLLSDGLALVADFGIARVVSAEARMTRTGMMLGTPVYMSPEQALGGEIDARADLYSLGCVLYEMLAGEPPFTGATPQSVQARHAFDPVPPLRTRRPGLHPGVEPMVERALAKTAADRFATAARFAEAIDAIATGVPGTPPPMPQESVTPNTLPKQRTSFVGREKELAECARLLGETRLLTLTGVGGCGKTRLGLKLAESLLESFPDGAWYVDLASLTDATRVPSTVAAAIDLRDEPGQDVTRTLVTHLAGKRALLLLDNCEHLLEPVGVLVDAVIAGTDAAKVLVTSREGLGLDGERVVTVRSMRVPADQRSTAFADIEGSEAVKLFVARARGVEPNFALTPANAATVALICRRLDGIPLAIELAAARVKLISVDQIAARLDDRFKLLTGGSRSALPRHQTLRATIQWSYDHLEPDEGQLLRTLSVFIGGWTLEAAAAVTEADEFEVLDGLGRLVDKSLVMVERPETGEPRYRMLETIRQFVLEKLNESGEGPDVRTRHYRYFMAMTEGYEKRMLASDAEAYLGRLDLEQENLVEALRWSVQVPSGVRQALSAVAQLFHWWDMRGHYELGERIAGDILALPEAKEPTIERAQALSALGFLQQRRGKATHAPEVLTEALEIARAHGDLMLASRTINGLALVAIRLEDYDRARVLLQESLDVARQIGSDVRIASQLNNLGDLEMQHGRYEQCLPLFEESLAITRRLGDPEGISLTLVNLSLAEIQLGRLASARMRLEEAMAVAGKIRARVIQAYAVEYAALLLHRRGQWRESARLLGAAAAWQDALGFVQMPTEARDRERHMDGLRTLAPGAAELEAALAEGRALTPEAALAEAKRLLDADRAAHGEG